MSSCHSKGNKCVRDIVKEIVRVQDEVADRDHCCDVSCERSIRDLLSPAGAGVGETTVPFILYCKDCKPFFASGLKRITDTGSSYFKCIETPVFRAKKFVNGSDSCVKLELLKPINNGLSSSRKKKCCKDKDVCDFLDDVTDFKATGICTTVDLDCFCGITCLEPTTPVMVMPADLNDDYETEE